MPPMDKEQLEQLKRQIEEEYRLDIAAIERLQRRFSAQGSAGSAASHFSAPAATAVIEPSSKLEPAAAQQDDITASLRTMFSSVRK